MSIALERNNSGGHQIERLRGMACMAAIYNSAEFSIGDRRSAAEVEEDEDRSSSSSSIGRNSDDSPAGQSSSDSEGEEVQSSSKDGALGNLEDLEEVLPIKYVILIQFLKLFAPIYNLFIYLFLLLLLLWGLNFTFIGMKLL